MEYEFINVTLENIEQEHLCCIIRTRKKHLGIESKRKWLKERLQEGHVFRKLNVKATCYIEYAPLETSWIPIIGNNYLYIYCLWVDGIVKGKGYGRKLMEYCILDAKEKGKSGICMLGSNRQKSWLSDQSFAKKFGFQVVDSTDDGYQLLALSFDNTVPRFTDKVKNQEIDDQELTIYYTHQCPYINQNIIMIKQYCDTIDVPVTFIEVDSLQMAKELPFVFNNWAVIYKGKFETVNLLTTNTLKRILKK